MFLRFNEGLENYREKSFQSHSDNGALADHTFKFANGIQKFFTASYTVLSLCGFININRPTYTKGNTEIEPVISSYHDVRINAGTKSLDRFESDGGSDKLVWEKLFKDDLEWGVQPYRPTKIDGLLGTQIERDQIVLVTCVTGANNWAHTMLSNISEANLAE